MRMRDGFVATLGFAALAVLSIVLGREAGAPGMLWLGGGLLLGWMLRSPAIDAVVVLLACAVLDAGLRAAFGTPVPVAGALAGIDLVEVSLAWLALRSWGIRDTHAAERSLSMVLAIVLLAPLAGGALVVWVLPNLLAVPQATLLDWWTGHALGMLALAPVAVAWEAGALRDTSARPSFWLALPVVLAAAAIALLPGYAVAAPVLVALVLLLAATRAGALGTALLALAGVLALVWADSRGADSRPLLFGLLTATAAIAPLLVSLLAGQRDEARQRAHGGMRRTQTLLEHTPGLVAQFGRDQRLAFANPAFLQWMGRSEGEAFGRRVHELFDEAAAVLVNGRMQRALAGQGQQFDLRLRDGRELRVRSEPQFATDGAIEGALLLAEDISWRGQAERRQAELLAAADPLVFADADGRISRANPAAITLLGGDPLQQPLTGLFDPISQPLIAEAHARLRDRPAGADEGDILVVQGVRNGIPFPLEARLTRVSGQGAIAIALRDLAAQETLLVALEAERAMGATLLDRIGDAVVGCDVSRRITLFNPIAEELSGWERSEAIGQPLSQVLRLVTHETGKPVPSPLDVALDAGAESRVPADTALLRRDGVRSPIEGLAAPVVDATGTTAGAVMVFRDMSETRATAMKMSHLAQYDYLTDLPNRVLLHDRLSQALAAAERGGRGALLFVDLDFFKNINDTLGHQAGDKVLQEVAKRLVASVRADDTVSRQGGDEFVLLLVRLADPRDAARVAEKLIQAIEQPFHVEGQALHISASVGIALFPQDARDIKTLMKQADTALYHAKESGRGRYSYFTGVMSEKAEQRMRMEHDLRFALANEDFFLAYQPKVLLPEGRITGMEALVRWRRSDTGEVVAPGDFIPVCEETGLIVALDEWVMAEACRQNRAWQDAGLPAVPVSVNVSLARFDAERLLAHVRATLQRTGLDPHCLEIEFTESQMFTHLERAQELIAQLKTLGVQVAMDDFGMGYSSLSYLVRYKFDTLKIDRSFVQGLPGDPKHAAIVQAIAGMARALDYHVVAEGVEEFAQADALRGYGCNEMQGYLYSRPVPAAEFEGILKRGVIQLPETRRFRA